jgi:hypothetical protein
LRPSSNLHALVANTTAAVSLPMRFVVASILLMVTMGLLATATSGFLAHMKMSSLESEMSRMDATASLLYSGGPGSNFTMEVDVPTGCTVVLGSIPGYEAAWPRDARNYFLEYDGKCTVRGSRAAYSNELMDGMAVLGSGKHRVFMETTVNPSDGMLFVRVYE